MYILNHMCRRLRISITTHNCEMKKKPNKTRWKHCYQQRISALNRAYSSQRNRWLVGRWALRFISAYARRLLYKIMCGFCFEFEFFSYSETNFKWMRNTRFASSSVLERRKMFFVWYELLWYEHVLIVGLPVETSGNIFRLAL